MNKLASAFDGVREFFDGVVSEMKKCSWPTWAELRGSTVVVLVSVILMATFIGLCDLFLNWSVYDVILRVFAG